MRNAFSNCTKPKKPQKSLQVTPAGCGIKSWKLQNFLKDLTDTVLTSAPIALSQTQWWTLAQTANCQGEPMTDEGKEWRFEAGPTDPST